MHTKSFRRIKTLLITASVVGMLAAASSLAPNPSAVAVVDLGKVFSGLNAWQALQDTKTQMAEAAQQDAAAQRSRIEELQADLEDFPESSDRHRDALRALQLAAIEFEANLTYRESQMSRFESRAIRDLYESIREAAAEYATANGFDMVLVDDGVTPIPEDAQDPIAMISSRRVLFASSGMDITDGLIAAMNKGN
ncbi:MAG: OmpH family outer membrane protein [Phycisphaerales bacterium]|nr:OmpH family outer membrane protein [Phycisphaerales bacterium]